MLRRFRKFTIVLLALLGALLCVGVAVTRVAARVVAREIASAPVAPAGPAPEEDDGQTVERWRVAMPVEVVGLPAVDAQGVVVTAGESEVVALSARGATSWTTAVAGALVNAPRLDADLIFVAAKRAVAALHRDSGAVAWTAPTAVNGSHDNRANRPVVVGDVVVASTASGRVFGLDRATGVPRWTIDLPTAITSEPAAGGGVVVVVGIGEWWGLDPATGATIWSGDLGTFGTSSPVVFDDAGVTLAAVASDGHVGAADVHTGQMVWRSDAEQSELFQVPVVTAERELLLADHWGRLAAYDSHTGHALWNVRGPDGVAEFGEPVPIGRQRVALPLDEGGPRIGSPSGSVALRPPGAGHGVAALPDDGLVVTTWDGPVNYVVAYDVEPPNR